MPNAPKLITKEKVLCFLRQFKGTKTGIDRDIVETIIADYEKMDSECFEVVFGDIGKVSLEPVVKGKGDTHEKE